MKINDISAFRLPLIAGHVVVIISMLACAAIGGGVQVQEGSLQLDDGVVEVKNDDGDWVPVAGKSTFELVGALDDMDPWVVAGVTLQTNETTQIAEDLQVGDLVRVRGTTLDDDTWLAYSIELAQEQTDPIIILIGVVDSVDPWVVNGIELNVTDETDIQGEITVGMLVRVEILLLTDGTWEVLSIVLLSDTTETSGCAVIVATIVNMSGDEIQFLGWPTMVTFEPNTQADNDNNDNGEDGEDDDDGNDDENENGDDGESVSAGQVVLAVVCVSDDGSLIIVQIIILDMDEDDVSTEGEKVLVCHKPDKKGGHTLSISSSAVPAHLGHGDTLGACP